VRKERTEKRDQYKKDYAETCLVKGITGRALKEQLLSVIKFAAQEPDKVFRISILTQAFALLDKLALKQNDDAPYVYACLIQCLANHYKQRPKEP
jgi:hypothetical protein